MYRLTRPIQLVQFHVYYVSSDIFLHMQHSYEHEPLDSGAYIHTVECTPRTETGLCSVSGCPNSTDTCALIMLACTHKIQDSKPPCSHDTASVEGGSGAPGDSAGWWHRNQMHKPFLSPGKECSMTASAVTYISVCGIDNMNWKWLQFQNGLLLPVLTAGVERSVWYTI